VEGCCPKFGLDEEIPIPQRQGVKKKEGNIIFFPRQNNKWPLKIP